MLVIFVPITCANVIFKIVTKTITNTLKMILPSIVGETQSAFVPNRLINYNALISFEHFNFMKHEEKGRHGFMGLKLDMSKAYDMVKWAFLKHTFISMGFPISWVSLIMRCVNTMSFVLRVNGNPHRKFSPYRGLRQGDLLSPYLFILCVEAL